MASSMLPLLLSAALLTACSAPPPPPAVDPRLPQVEQPAPQPEASPTASPQPATDQPTPEDPPPPAATDAATPAATEAAGAADPPEQLQLGLERIAELDQPIALALRPGDATLYVAERPGRVVPVSPDGEVGAPLLDISGSTTTTSERGLLGIAWTPDGDALLLSSTGPEGETLLQSVPVSGGSLDLTAARELVRVAQPASNHNGGNVAIGPDGHIWLALGDGGGADDEFDQAQDATTLLGSIVRLTLDGDPAPGNPFNSPEGDPRVWGTGLRNPWRFSFDAPTGDLWLADVGQNTLEEINRVPSAAAAPNFGWPHLEGDRPFDGTPPPPGVTDPVHTYAHSRGCSITGGHVHRGEIPELVGAYLYSDFCNGDIYALYTSPAGEVLADLPTGASTGAVVSFGQGADGESYVLSLDGGLYQLVAR